jgi:hypothetical protein
MAFSFFNIFVALKSDKCPSPPLGREDMKTAIRPFQTGKKREEGTRRCRRCTVGFRKKMSIVVMIAL